MLGGSSATNFMVFTRGFSADFDAWGDTEWSWNKVLPYFKKYEGNEDPEYVAYDNGYYHNANGPVKIQKPTLPPYSQYFADALKAVGAPFIPDLNANWTLGYTICQSTVAYGIRSSTAQEYLSPNRNRKNLYVIKNAYADRILIDKNNRAYGVEFTYKRNGKKHKLKALAKREVIVSAGTILSPPLLMRAGIGPISELKRCNIMPRSILPVGDNYSDHLMTYTVFKYNYTTPVLSPELVTLNNLFQYVTEKKGPFSAVPYISGYVDSTNSTNLPDIQFFFLQLPMGTPATEIQSFNIYTDFPKLNSVMLNANKEHALSILALTLLQPKSRGYIRMPQNCESHKPYIY